MMVNIVGAISNSMLSAFSRLSAAQTCVGVYEVAKARGDTAVMERAISYASPNISKAMEYSSDISDDVRKALKKAREEEAERIKEQNKAEQTDKNDTAVPEGENDSIDSSGTSGITENDHSAAVAGDAATTEYTVVQSDTAPVSADSVAHIDITA